jgi:hypothetical protein
LLTFPDAHADANADELSVPHGFSKSDGDADVDANCVANGHSVHGSKWCRATRLGQYVMSA